MAITVVAAASQVEQLRRATQGSATVVACDAWQPTDMSVVWVDGLSATELEQLGAVLVSTGMRPVVVLGARWAGFEPVPLAPLARGVISGFGVAGVHAAISTLSGTE